MSNKKTIQQYWTLISEQKWDVVKELLHKEFVAHYPQTKEKFVGADNFIGMNAEYPGHHLSEIQSILEEDDRVCCIVFISADTGQTTYSTGYFEFKDGKILKATEYWGDEYQAPENRRKWRA